MLRDHFLVFIERGRRNRKPPCELAAKDLDQFCGAVGYHEVVRVGTGPVGNEARELGLSDRIIRDDLTQIVVEDIEHFGRREVHVV